MLNRQIILLSFFFSLFLASCGNNELDELLDCKGMDCLLDGNSFSFTGWLIDKEDPANTPQDIQLSNFASTSTSLPRTATLESKFPPVQSQGQYGTCTAWATGYYMKTALNAIENGWTTADLAKPANQTSPKDLFFNTPGRGDNCSGSSFSKAMDVLIDKGAASLSSVPYTNMGNCSGSSRGDASNKLANYRMIAANYAFGWTTSQPKAPEGMTEDNFKGYLAQGRPVLFGAKLGDKFGRWNSSSVLSSDTYNEPNRQHSFHAMVVVGYDDSKKAFRVRNSWGTNWGDNGSIWVDYNFFLNNFAYIAYVAQNAGSPIRDDREIEENRLLDGYDLLASLGEDVPDDDPPPGVNRTRARLFSYDVYNSGRNPIKASQKWSVLYMYYNAMNANEYEVIFEDYYTNTYGNSGSGCDGYCGDYPYTEAFAGAMWNNMDVLPGKRAGEDFFPGGFWLGYEMPIISGKYYLVVMADAYDDIEESNEDNNFFFLGDAGGKPLEIRNGVLQSEPHFMRAKTLAKSVGANKVPKAQAKSVKEIGGSPNAYTPAEIKSLILHSKKNGTLAKKIADYRETSKKPVKRPRT